MPFQPVVDTRFALSFTVLTGGAISISSTVSWPSVTVDYGNEGAETEPPTRSYVNIIDDSDTDSSSTGSKVALIMPLSNENIFVQDPLSEEGLRCSVKWVNRLRRF